MPVTLAEAPKLAREMKKYQDEVFEFTARDITFFDRASEKWAQEQTGVLVEQVKPGGWAALGDLVTSDLIIGIDDQPVNTVDDVGKRWRHHGKCGNMWYSGAAHTAPCTWNSSPSGIPKEGE